MASACDPGPAAHQQRRVLYSPLKSLLSVRRFEFWQHLHPLIDRREVRRRLVEQLLETFDDEVGLLVAVDLVAGAHDALDVQRQALGFRTFDRVVMQHYGQMVETMNALLERDGILPSLAYVPIRVRPVLQKP